MIVYFIGFQAVVFIILVLVLRLYFRKHLDIALKRLKILYQDNLAQQAKLSQELEKSNQERRLQMENARRQANEIIETAKKEAHALKVSLEDQAERSAREIVRKGNDEAEKLKVNILREIEGRAFFLAIDMIRQAFTVSGRQALQKAFIEEVFTEIEKIDIQQFLVKNPIVNIKSSIALEQSEKDKLVELLSKKIGLAVELKIEDDPDVIAGLVIQIESLIIDGSLKNRLKKVVSFAK